MHSSALAIHVKSTDKHWEYWGSRFPYYGVFTADKLRHPDAQALDEFFQTGEQHIRNVFDTIGAFAPTFRPSRAMDFGCGTGRILVPLSKSCRVLGIDISPSMLAEARKNVDARGVGSNVELARSDDRLSQVVGDFDLIHSFIVFQHIPIPRGMVIANELLERLRPAGVAVLHFTYARHASSLRRTVAWIRSHVPLAHYPINLATGRKGAPMQMNSYSLKALFDLMRDHHCVIRTIDFTDHSETLGALFYMQRCEVAFTNSSGIAARLR
jgi:SAM-dependent methyltransferase